MIHYACDPQLDFAAVLDLSMLQLLGAITPIVLSS